MHLLVHSTRACAILISCHHINATTDVRPGVFSNEQLELRGECRNFLFVEEAEALLPKLCILAHDMEDPHMERPGFRDAVVNQRYRWSSVHVRYYSECTQLYIWDASLAHITSSACHMSFVSDVHHINMLAMRG